MIAPMVREWINQQPPLYRRACRVFGYAAVAGVIQNKTVDELADLAKARHDPISTATLFRQLPMLEWYGLIRRENNFYVDEYGSARKTANTFLVDYRQVIPSDHISSRELARTLREAGTDPIGAWIAAHPFIAENVARLHEREAYQPSDPPF